MAQDLQSIPESENAPPAETSAPRPQKPPAINIYTMLLFVSLLALTLGSVILWWELGRVNGLFGYPWWDISEAETSFLLPISSANVTSFLA